MNLMLITVRSDCGGGPAHLLDLLKYFKNTAPSWDITVVSPNDPPFADEFKKYCDDFIEIPARTFNPIKLNEITKKARKKKIDIIHSHGRGAGIYSRILGGLGFPVVHTFHGFYPQKDIKSKIKETGDKLLKRFAKLQIAVSRAEKDIAIKEGVAFDENTIVIPNGIDFDGMEQDFNSKDHSELKKSLGLSEDTFLLGTLSRLHYQKGLDELIQYFSDFVSKSILASSGSSAFDPKKVYLLLGGDGPEGKKLKALHEKLPFKEQIKFLGEVDDNLGFLKGIDLYVSGARWEGMPLSVLEAMGFGLPCLLSSIPAHEELLESGKEGMLFSDSSEFTRHLKFLLADGERRTGFAKNAQSKIRSAHTLENMCQSTLKAYERVIKTGAQIRN